MFDRGPAILSPRRGGPQGKTTFRVQNNVAADVLEAESRRRAVEGIEVRHYDRDGKLVWTEHKYSDTLLIFLLKGVRPNKYRDNATLRHEFQGPRLLVGPRNPPPAIEPPSN